MTAVISRPDTQKKLEILSADSQYDLACACGTRDDEHRKRGAKGWIYPVALPTGGTSVLFKTLISNVCSNDCKYCPLKGNADIRRCTLGTDELIKTFLDLMIDQGVRAEVVLFDPPYSPRQIMECYQGIGRNILWCILVSTLQSSKGYVW